MAHITDFEISELSGREDTLSFHLDRYLNVFFGVNGSGKTSLLKVLHSAMEDETTILSRVAFKEAHVDIYSQNFKRVIHRQLKRVSHLGITKEADQIMARPNDFQVEIRDPAISPFHASSVSFIGSIQNRIDDETWVDDNQENKMANMPRAWHHRYLPTTRLQLLNSAWHITTTPKNATGTYSGTLSEEVLDGVSTESMLQIWQQYSFGINRKIRNAQEEGLTRILEDVILETTRDRVSTSDLNQTAAYDSLKRFLAQQNSKISLGPVESFSKRFKTDEIFRQVVTDIHRVELEKRSFLEATNAIQNTINGLYSRGKHIRLGEDTIELSDERNRPLNLSLLSSGEKHLLRILVDTIVAENSTIIIDEPELSLHVDWQLDLVGIMRQLNPEAQIILATHSPEIVARIPEGNIFRL